MAEGQVKNQHAPKSMALVHGSSRQHLEAWGEQQTKGWVRVLPTHLPKCVARAARRDAPAAAVIWIRPQQVAHGALVRHLPTSRMQCVSALYQAQHARRT